MENGEVYQKRDILLAEIHSGIARLEEKVDEGKEALKNHKIDDEKFQEKIDKKFDWMLKIGVIVAIIVAANGGLSAIKTLLHL